MCINNTIGSVRLLHLAKQCKMTYNIIQMNMYIFLYCKFESWVVTVRFEINTL